MAHDHHKHDDGVGKSLLWSTILNFSVALIQLFGGIVANSLSLISDAVHNLGDASAIFGAYIANRIGKRRASASKTYGYKRAEIIAAFINALALILISVYLFVEAFKRLQQPETLDARLMLLVASAGLLVNVISVFLLRGKRKGNLNVKAAYLHLISDTFSSIAVIIGAITMYLWDVFWLDPVLTLFVNVLILRHTYHVLKESFNVLMQSTPDHINVSQIKQDIEKISGVLNAHHLHAWTLDGEKVYFDCHVEFKQDKPLSDVQSILLEIQNRLKTKFHLHHITLQPEFESKHANIDIGEKC